MSRTDAEFQRVRQLTATTSLSDYAIARITGVPRATVLRWRHRAEPPRTAPPQDWVVPDPARYCYLLGCYLGDGHVTRRRGNSWELRVACDRRYLGIIAEILEAMGTTFPGGRPSHFPASIGASEVLRVSHPGIRLAFPQHGSGRKHLRKIELEEWQRQLTHRNPGSLIRGLIHSDGCRSENRFKTKLPSGRMAEYAYVRYFFSNLSADIRAIFVEHCELLGIRVTRSNHRNLSISHRRSTAILDEIVGPKS